MIRYVTLTSALHGRAIEVPVGRAAIILEDGPHGGAVIAIGSMRIGVRETRQQVRAMIEDAEDK